MKIPPVKIGGICGYNELCQARDRQREGVLRPAARTVQWVGGIVSPGGREGVAHPAIKEGYRIEPTGLAVPVRDKKEGNENLLVPDKEVIKKLYH